MRHAARNSNLPERRAGGYSAHSVRLAGILAFAYLLTIVYASLQPFRGWRMPAPEIIGFLGASWPRYITLEDIVVNVAAYLPLGFLLSIVYSARYRAGLGVLAAAFLAAALSLTLEAIQMLLPSRTASNVDLLTNGLGALIGAMAAPLFAPSRILGGKLHALRHRLFLEGMAADVGLVIACLWPLTQFHPTAQPFGTGAVKATFDLPAYFTHTPGVAFSLEAGVVLLNLLGVGMMISALLLDAPRRMAVIGWVTAAALVIKAVTALVLVKSSAPPWGWITPGVLLGLAGGWVLLYGATRLPRAAQLALAALCIMLATVAINLAPDNPYQSVPVKLLAGGQSHFLSFTGIMRALSELWPLLALTYLVCALALRPSTPPREGQL
jgi:VanZ family protein